MEASTVESLHAVEATLRSAISEHLQHHLTSNATFLAERLVAQFPCEANIVLLATCYHRGGATYRSYTLLRGLDSADARYLFAVCCVELGKLTEAEGVLIPDNEGGSVPNGAAGLYLLGRVYQLSNRHTPAVKHYLKSLKLDPLLWCAFEQLCVLSPEDAKAYLDMNPVTTQTFGPSQQDGAYMTPMNSSIDVPMNVNTAQVETMPPQSQKLIHPQGRSHVETPEMASGSFETPRVAPAVVHPPPMRKGSKDSRDSGVNYTPMVSPMLLSGSQFLGGRKFLDEGTKRVHGLCPGDSRTDRSLTTHWHSLTLTHASGSLTGTVRKISSKLFSEPATALKIAQAHVESPWERTSGIPVSTGIVETRGMPEVSELPGAMSTIAHRGTLGRSSQGQAECVSLLQLLGVGYRYLSMYECDKAIEAFSKVPLPHYSTGWVLQCIGQAYFEMVDYHASERTFQQLRLLDPCRLEGLEVYSTVLWHMKKEVQLSGLAQEAIALDRHSPVAWCIMCVLELALDHSMPRVSRLLVLHAHSFIRGNCFSLQKEHETALRFFQRSLQLDPTFTYAYTLCGHEYFANEDFDKGLTCYRNAIRLNPRHYNAWFGSGHIYFRQEKYGMAEYHFRRAHSINHRSSVLMCYLGMALHKVKRTGEAIQTLKQAVSFDPKNPLARFEYASVLASIGDLDKAIAELTLLHSIVPREASVLFQKGKVLKRLGRLDEALQCFSDALDLQPPSIDTNLIKSAIDRIYLDDGEDDDI